MTKHRVASLEDIPPGMHKIVIVRGREIGIFNVHGTCFAILNVCPHQGAPVCLGRVDGTNLPSRPDEYIWGRQGELLRCPWHGWEFDLPSGRALFNPQIMVKTYPVEVSDHNIYAHISGEAKSQVIE